MDVSGEKLKRLREDLALTQREVAERAGVSPATINKIEKGVVTGPHPSTVRKLADALSVEPKDLR